MRKLFTIVVLSLGLVPSTSQAALTVGYFDPYGPFASPLRRAEFAEDIAAALSSVSTKKFRGAAYSKGADLIRDIKNGRVRLAIVNPQILWMVEPEKRPTPVLAGLHERQNQCPYALFVRSRSKMRNLLHLKSRRLAVVRTGYKDRRFIFNMMLDGEIRDQEYFNNIVYVPDIAGAIGTVRFRKADAFFGLDIDYRKSFEATKFRKIAAVGSSLCAVVIMGRQLAEGEKQGLVTLLKASRAALAPVVRTIGIEGFSDIPSGSLAKLEKALRADPPLFKKAAPMFIPIVGPDEQSMLDSIQEMGKKFFPDPNLLLIESNKS